MKRRSYYVAPLAERSTVQLPFIVVLKHFQKETQTNAKIGRASWGKSVDLGGRRIIKKKKKNTSRKQQTEMHTK